MSNSVQRQRDWIADEMRTDSTNRRLDKVIRLLKELLGNGLPKTKKRRAKK